MVHRPRRAGRGRPPSSANPVDRLTCEERLAWWRYHLKRPDFNPLTRDADAAMYYELRRQLEYQRWPPLVPRSDVLDYWRLAVRARGANFRLVHPRRPPKVTLPMKAPYSTRASSFLRLLEDPPIQRLIERGREQAHPALLAFWTWCEYEEQPKKSARPRSTLSMRRKRGTPPKMRYFINLIFPGWAGLPDWDATKKFPGHPKDIERESFPAPLIAALLADLCHEASGRREWSYIEDKLKVHRQNVERMRRGSQERNALKALRKEWLEPMARRFLHTGIL